LFSKLNPRIPRVWRVLHNSDLIAVCSTEFWAFEPLNGQIDLGFAQSYLSWYGFLNDPHIKPASSTNSHQRVNTKAFDKHLMPLPPLSEQKRIAEILSSVDESIQSTEAVIEQAERVKQGLMEELLTGSLGSEAIERGEVPEGWHRYQLKQLLRSIDGGVSVNSQSEPAQNNQQGILKTSCINKGSFSQHENKVVVDEHEQSRLKEPVCANTIIFSRMNTPKLVGANAYVPVSYSNIFLPDRLWALKINEENVVTRWLAYLLDYYFRAGVFELLGSGTSGSMKNISKAKLKDLKLVLPSKAEQRKAVDVLKGIDDTIQIQKQLFQQRLDIKKGLMDDLLTGKVRTV